MKEMERFGVSYISVLRLLTAEFPGSDFTIEMMSVA
jgi:hypothetical protein